MHSNTDILTVSEIPSVVLVFIIILATDLWMSNCECITVGGLLSIHVQHFTLTFELTALPHIKHAFRYCIAGNFDGGKF